MFPRSASPEAPAPVPVAVAVVLRPSSQARRPPFLLIGQRASGGHLPDQWEFPGGKIEATESGAECARRELLEETGVRAEWVRRLHSAVHHYPDRTIEIEFHLFRYRDGVPWPCAARAVRWTRAESLDCYRFADGSRAILPMLIGLDLGDDVEAPAPPA